jgi:23S rRNA-/tRNA-specific pseudouridylate synthase
LFQERSIETGLVTINDKVSEVGSIVKNGGTQLRFRVKKMTYLTALDLISHKIHRHEPPVAEQRVEIVFENEEILVINKPAGVPVRFLAAS